jgi:putative sigma-54 modulation protein
MNTSVVGRKIELTDAIKNHIDSSVEVFKKYNLDIISVNSIISQNEKNGKREFTFEFTINIAHKDTIVIKQKDKDLYSAIDVAVDRACKVLRRHHDKVSAHKAEKFTEAAQKEGKVLVELENIEDEIVPVELQLYKPLEIEEALEELKSGEEQFKVFYDKDDNMRVIFKMAESNKFGLY